MPGFPGHGPWPEIRKDLERPNRRPAIAVVAFIGSDAPLVMPLRSGDVLVCDASPLAIKRGLTNVSALRSYHRRGIRIFSMSGLHAKVIAWPTSAWIGSANASKNSEARLLEASVRVTGTQARRIYRWAESLATDESQQTVHDLRQLSKISVQRFTPSPVLETISLELPTQLARLWFFETGEHLTVDEERTVSSDRHLASAEHQKTGSNSKLDWIFVDAPAQSVTKGDWMIDVRNGRVRNPAQVIRVRPTGRDLIIWHASIPSAHPSISRLRSLEPLLQPGFTHLRVTGKTRVDKVLELFR